MVTPLFLCLLIPRIKRHGCVMTEIISPSTTSQNHLNTIYIISNRSTPGQTGRLPTTISAILSSPSSLPNTFLCPTGLLIDWFRTEVLNKWPAVRFRPQAAYLRTLSRTCDSFTVCVRASFSKKCKRLARSFHGMDLRLLLLHIYPLVVPPNTIPIT